MNNKKLISVAISITLMSNCFAQQPQTRPDSEFRSSSVFYNYSNSIFNRPIESYKYVKTARGVEIYKTYSNPTNDTLNQTIFPKSMPLAVIKKDSSSLKPVIYINYTNSIFNKPIQKYTISQEALPTYDGE